MKRIIYIHTICKGKVNTMTWSPFGKSYNCLKCNKEIPADEVTISHEEHENHEEDNRPDRKHINSNIR